MASDQIRETRPLSGPILKCPSHALPFRAIFQEYRVRRGANLLELVHKHIDPNGRLEKDRLFPALEECLLASEHAYADLEKGKQQLNDTEALESACAEADAPLKRILHDLKGTALCLSGGGIRSASYCLGVLEGLARYSQGLNQAKGVRVKSLGKPLLQGLDYLSTVSGGGYIGSWLTAWTFRKGNNGKAFQDVIRAMAGENATTSADPEPRTIRHLRDYTSFLAPKLGLSLDTWALAAIVLRNLLVNWMMMVPLLVALVALPQFVRYAMIGAAGKSQTCLLVLASICFLVSAITAAVRMPSRQDRRPLATKNYEPYVVFFFFVLPIFLAGLFLTEVRLGFSAPSKSNFNMDHLLLFFAMGVVCFGVIALFLFVSTGRRHPASDSKAGVPAKLLLWRTLEFAVVASFVAFLAASTLEGLASFGANAILASGTDTAQSAFILCAIPMVFAVLMVASSMFSGLLGIFEAEIDREWWARAGGLMIFVAVGWASTFALTIYGSTWAGVLRHLPTLLTGAAAGGAGVAAGAGGATSTGTREVKSSQIGTIGKLLTKYHLTVPLLCASGLLVIGIGISVLESYLASEISPTRWMHYLQNKICLHFGWSLRTILLAHMSILLAAIIAWLLSNWFININIFSLHGMYRMRLMRAFLGASNTKRRPDDFVNFDSKDSPSESELANCEGVPLHVINSTLNMVGTQDLAWQQRKAESFTFSPVSCGGWRVGYVPTEMYAGRQGLSLATAMAISGAAFNPNMGYHSSPLVTLLMTFFNVRLGWWLPNPACADTQDEHGRAMPTEKGKRFLRKNGPTVALEPLLKEALGKTDSTSNWIELTDGAHFENLGLYEMVLRRCRRIIVVDVGADPEYQFEDLGNALRKIEIDLGIPIRFERQPNMEKERSLNSLYCAVAKIDYECADRFADPNVAYGELVYIKASLRGDEPPDIRQYAATHSTFPHETTANQFFNESQFESYRHLGSLVVDQIVEKGIHEAHLRGRQPQLDVDMESFSQTAEAYAMTKPKIPPGGMFVQTLPGAGN
jgi:hypothetical protein